MPEKKIPRVTIFCFGPDFIHLGPRRVSAYLRSHGIDARMAFVPGDRRGGLALSASCERQLLDAIAGDTVVGMSLFSNHLAMAEGMTRLIKRALPVPVVWGGIHATVAPESSLDCCDAACVGEGEAAFLDYINATAAGADTARLQNLWLRRGGAIVRNGQRPLLADLDLLPFPDYEIERHFILTPDRFGPLSRRDLRRSLGFAFVNMITFGCPFRCAYCINDRLHGLCGDYARIRRHSIDYFIAETRYLLDKLPFVYYLDLEDDAFISLPMETVEEFCEKYRREIRLPFAVGGVRPEGFTEGKMAALRAAGMIGVRMGIQSASVRVCREVYNRSFSADKTLAAARIINRHGRGMRPPFYDIITDNPWESIEEKLETAAFIRRLPRPNYLQLFSLTFFPGTRLHQRALDEKIISKFDPARRYRVFKKTAANLLMLYASVLPIPERLFTWILSSRFIRDERREYPLLYVPFIAWNLLHRLLSYYANPRFLAAKMRRRAI